MRCYYPFLNKHKPCVIPAGDRSLGVCENRNLLGQETKTSIYRRGGLRSASQQIPDIFITALRKFRDDVGSGFGCYVMQYRE